MRVRPSRSGGERVGVPQNRQLWVTLASQLVWRSAAEERGRVPAKLRLRGADRMAGTSLACHVTNC